MNSLPNLHIKPSHFLLYLYNKYGLLSKDELTNFIENNRITYYGTNKLENNPALQKRMFLPIPFGKYECMLRAYQFNNDIIQYNMNLIKKSKKMISKTEYKLKAKLQLKKKKEYAVFKPDTEMMNTYTKYEFFYITKVNLIEDINNFYKTYELPYDIKLHYNLYKYICQYYNNLMYNHQTFKVYLLNFLTDSDICYKYYIILYSLKSQNFIHDTIKYKIINKIKDKLNKLIN